MLNIKSMTKSFRAAVVLFAILLLLTVTNFGQTVSATLSGVVSDERGAVVPGATVVAVDKGTGFQRGTTANEEGVYTIPQLAPGKYDVQVTQTGFSNTSVRDVTLNASDRRDLNIVLKVGEVGAVVEVEGNEVAVVKTSSEVSTVVDRQFVENLPLNGRSFQSLIALTPGVVRSSGEGQFNVNGQRDNSNYFTIDGVSANVGISSNSNPGQSGAGQTAGFNAVGGTSGLISVDAMQEFRIQTSTYSAEFGRTPGGQIQIVSRAGKNKFEGTVFEYFRNEALDANNYFNNRSGLRKPPLRQNDFGFVLGGPIVLPNFGEGGPIFEKSASTFFFFSYEGLRLRLPITAVNRIVPSLATRAAAPAVLQPYLNALPLPNGANTTNGGAFFNASFANPSNIDATSVRIDHNVNTRLNIFGRFSISPSVAITRGVGSLSTLSNSRKNINTLTFGSTQTLTNSLVNEIRGNFSKNTGSTKSVNDNFGGAVPISDTDLFPSFANPETDFVVVNFSAFSSSFSRGSNVENTQRQINVVDNLTWIRGNHSLKFGADYRYLFPTAQPQTYGLQINFFDLASVNNAAPQAVVAFSNDRVRVQLHNFSLYGQDTWRASKRLTLDFGLRWEYNPPPSGRGGDILYTVDRVNDPANVLLAPAGTPLYKTVKDAFAPRFGAAYQLRDGDQGWLGATVIRGGVGIFYDLGSANALATTQTFPHRRVNNQFNPAGFRLPFAPAVIAPPTLANFNPPFTGQDLIGFDPDYSLPRTYQWNAAVEQGIGKNQTLSISYIGSAGRKLLRQERQRSPGNVRFNNLFVYRSQDESDYNAMQIQFTRRLTKGFQALANYTFAKSFDTASNDSPALAAAQGSQTQESIALERGPSSFDVRHNFNLTVSYEIPVPIDSKIAKAILGGWAIDSIFSARSGLPINVTFARNLGTGNTTARPDLVPGVPIWIDDPLVAGGRRLNPLAFVPSTTVRQGTLQRNSIYGFSFHQLDFALRRQFNLGERVRLQLKGEVFNAFNHPNFSNPNPDLGFVVDPGGVFTRFATFGISTTMLSTGLSASGFSSLYQPGGPRSVQLTAKINF